MAQAAHRRNDQAGEDVIRLPRSTDAVGAALRGAFSGGCQVPDDFLAVLRKLDAHLPH